MGIGHAIGFFHEQSRSDRDNYVNILSENIRQDYISNFRKATDNNYSVPYDFSSDMHYGCKGFTSNGKLTITTKDQMAQELIGQRTGLSHYDKLLANTMYPCIEKWMESCSLTSNPCQNDGYVGADCSCVCRSGTSGQYCENAFDDYYTSLLSGCSEVITGEGTLTSPNYPSSYPSGLKCTKYIKAPECNTVRITFNAFNMYGKNAYCGSSEECCYFDTLEIRTSNLYSGEVYCGNDISAGQTFTSPTNELILYMDTAASGSGWSADVAFTPVPNCVPRK